MGAHFPAPGAPRPRAGRVRWRRLLLLPALLFLALAADRAVLWLVLADDMVGGQVVAPFDPPLFTRGQRGMVAERVRLRAESPERFLQESQFDPELGWCARPGSVRGELAFDARGARVPLAPDGRPAALAERAGPLVVALGCSFTRGDEVACEEAWPFLVAQRTGLGVANLGAGGHGLDQALLRWRRDGLPLSPAEVWLGFLPSATLRVSSSFPPLQNHWSTVLAAKPRFELDADGALELVPLPVGSPDELLDLLADQRAFLAAFAGDPWIERAPRAFAPRGSSWTHAFAGTRLVLTWLEGRGRDPGPWLAEQDSPVRRLLVAIVRELDREVRASGARLRVSILPGRRDLGRAAAGDVFWQGLAEELAGAGIEVLDVTPSLLAARADGEADLWRPFGHYGAAANRVVAEAIARAWGPR